MPPGEKTPALYSAAAQDDTSIVLSFGEAADPVDRYVLEFGTRSGEYPYGASNIGGRGTRTYLVQSLQPNTLYYFRVRGGNGCATGGWSNELSAKTAGKYPLNTLTFLETKLESKKSEPERILPRVEHSSNSCREYTVSPKDTLESVALSQLGDSTRWKEIVEQNSKKYPSLEKNARLEAGSKLLIDCQEQQTTSQESSLTKKLGFQVNVEVTDRDKLPVKGAEVTLHSTIQKAVTDEKGVARFENVEPGVHRVLIAYQHFSGEQSINLSGESTEVTLNIVIERKSVLTSPIVIGIITILLGIIGVLVCILLRRRG
jgi:hypothetical protein